ncbi:hypothetical protein MNBD_ACTINO01-1577 [hydrothermal vent metagenome]|uniref:Uncharacterized protein n=1 Tax=hydrothermal vent metagenome TaxID=652676 RepID=A0A3B0R7K2_9ZZZZ
MGQVFDGSILLSGETGPGLHATFERGSEFVRLLTGDDELGTWEDREVAVAPAGKGEFALELGGENLTFRPSSPSAFAEAMSIPLQPEPAADSADKKPKYDIDAAIDEAIANVRPLTDPNADDDILSRFMLVGILGTAAVLMAGLVGMSLII